MRSGSKIGSLIRDRAPRSVMRTVVRMAVRPLFSPRVPLWLQRRGLDALTGLAVLPHGTAVWHQTLGGRPAERLEAPGADTSRAVLYLHGGGYAIGSLRTHRALAAHLAAGTNAPVHIVDYRRAPEDPYPAAVEDAVAAYQELLDHGLAPQRLVVAGDSAGGGLTLALALRLRDRGLPLPGALGLISPWVDLTMSNPGDESRDPMLRLPWVRTCADMYAGTTSKTAPEVSPIFGDLAGLPPMLVHACSDEILLPDAERLVERAKQADVPVTYRHFAGLWHVMHQHAGLMAESTAAVRELGESLASTADRC